MSRTDVGAVSRETTRAKAQKLGTMWNVSETSLEHQSTKCEGWDSINSWGGKVCRSCTMKGLSCHVEEFGFYSRNNVVVVQSLSHVQLFDHGLQHTRLPCPSLSQSLLRFMSIELVMLSHHLIPCRPLLLLLLIFPSIRVFSNGSARNNREPLKDLMSLGELRELVWTGRPGVLQFMGLQRVSHD